MKKLLLLIIITKFLGLPLSFSQDKHKNDSVLISPNVDTRVDNNLYWSKKIKDGLVKIIPRNQGVWNIDYIGSKISSELVKTDESVDIMIGTEHLMQSENSIFIDPTNITNIVVSMNTGNSRDAGFELCRSDVICAVDYNLTQNDGVNWSNSNCNFGNPVVPINGGDPSAVIGSDGTRYLGYITRPNMDLDLYAGGQGVSFLPVGNTEWIDVVVSTPPNKIGMLLDKNHLWTDNSSSSEYNGQLYDAWTYMDTWFNTDDNDGEIQLYYSHDGGYSWELPDAPSDGFISKSVNAGIMNHGVNLHTGPNGEAYAVWAIYDNWPADENAYGFASSFDGGNNWNDALRIVDDIQGIRVSGAGIRTRVNSFPSMAVDLSNGLHRGTIYIVFAVQTQITFEDYGVDIFLIKSTNEGNTWTEPTQINEDNLWIDYEQSYFPWLSCDPETGILSIVFYHGYYQNQNIITKVANSLDGGSTWDEFIISDYSFLPIPLLGTLGADEWAPHYFGDYLGIDSHCGMVYPIWTSNLLCERAAESYTSPYQIGEDDLFLNGQAESKTYFALNNITASYQGSFVISESSKTALTSGNMIKLEPGFHSEEGSVFNAFNCNCGTDNIQSQSSQTSLTINGNKTLNRSLTDTEIFIKTFPNPVIDKLIIESENLANEYFLYEICSLNGQVIEKGYLLGKSKIQIDLSNLPSNLYILKIVTKNNNLVKKFVKL